MMRQMKIFFIAALVCLALVGEVRAEKVRVIVPVEENVSSMALRKKAMAEGYALAVYEAAMRMLPGELGETRGEAFKNYLRKYATPYVQGYKTLSSQMTEEGLVLALDVKVNKRTLRDALKRLGFVVTMNAPLPAAVAWPDDLDEMAVASLHGLISMTGVRVTPDVLPSVTIERASEKLYRGRLAVEGRQWVEANKDLARLWVDLWAHYFMQTEETDSHTALNMLTVSGWFSSDAALEFDRVLKGWDSAVQDVNLTELDMQPTGVGGTWRLRLLSRERLNMLLESYLPQRGLTYQLSEGAQ